MPAESEKLIEATNELAKAINRLCDLHDRLWLSLPAGTRAKILGVSPATERRRRNKLEYQRILAGGVSTKEMHKA